jgi:hypothetical protein
MALLPVNVRDAPTHYHGLKASYERRLSELEDIARLGY